jgi:glutaredoxin-like protein
MFTQQTECEFCKTTRELLDELVDTSDKISLEVYDFVADEAMVKKYGIDKIPAIVLLGDGDKDFGIRFFGIPAGYEFTTLVEDILDVGRGAPQLPQEILDELAKVNVPVHMQVMVSPTCPYCPKAVRAAHKFAMVSEHIRGDMVEVSEFPHVAIKYDVQGVPNTVINEDHSLVGAVPEMEAVQELLKAIGSVN